MAQVEIVVKPMNTATQLISVALAFWLGYSVNKTGTCVVAAANEIVQRRRARRALGLLIASLAAGLITTVLAWTGSLGATLASVTSVGLWLLVGATIFGVGALVNDACLLGSLGRVGNGESRLLALPVGLSIGFLIVHAAAPASAPGQDSVLSRPSAMGAAVLLLFLLLIALLAWHLKRVASERDGLAAAPAGMMILGLAGGALYALAPAWAYLDLLFASLPSGPGTTRTATFSTVIAAVAGAIASARHARTWKPRGASLRQLGRTFMGGVLMGAGAALIPGGNDSLILAAMPALSVGGTVAYGVMFAVIAVLIAAMGAGVGVERAGPDGAAWKRKWRL